jgi:hypothetical protein
MIMGDYFVLIIGHVNPDLQDKSIAKFVPSFRSWFSQGINVGKKEMRRDADQF